MEDKQRAEEDAWLRSAQNGDADAFGYLFRRYHERTVRTLLAMMGSEAEARDVAQQAWVKAWQKIDRYNFEAAFSTWMHRITVNTALDALRKRQREQQRTGSVEEIEQKPSTDATPDRRLQINERWRELLSALDQLPEEQRSALVLRELNGYSYQEIADATHVKTGTVMSRLHAARQKLATIWKNRS
ncbi:RNA polymerase sigma factor [Cerasicoccus fimbriatus]|uniref:RNA polymerase sigma factor n=1 Tax=Cerasicoccus fimbriatus TaxID=3014554 RepID=UPI0022B2B5BC|nr:sigma-70 family RNA polymerase sigma factor [Cerasicoccus sp. TK19100]